MQLDSCRELKARLSIEATRASTQAEAPRLALGISPDLRRGYALAVRITGEDPTGTEAMIADLQEQARGEIDVRRVGRIRALSAPTEPDAPQPAELQQRVRPLIPGLSVAHPDVTAGTLGGFVRIGGALHVLSNNHVLANSDRARVGDPTLQPGPADGGTAADRIGALAAWVDLDPAAANHVDAAVALLDEGVDVDLTAYPGGPLDSVRVDPPESPAVAKIGRTTGFSTGRVTAFEVDGLVIDYPEGAVSFDDQIEVEGDVGSFSDGGDSGSVIFTRDPRAAYALLFAGSTSGGSTGAGLTYANPLATVLVALEADWVGAT